MSEPKTTCVDCGRTILQRTADRRDGRCAPCHVRMPVIIPEGFELPHDLLERLVALDEDPARFRKDAWSQGLEYVAGYIDKLEERRALYWEWAPRLRAFAARCREDRPAPQESVLGTCERAMQQIYGKKLKRQSPPGRETNLAICAMPLIAMSVAERLWPCDDDHRVLLTPEEDAEWDQIYSHPHDAFRWFSHYTLRIIQRPNQRVWPAETKTLTWWNDKDLSDGESPWLVQVGSSFGPLCGSGHTELWAWNGSRARFIRVAMKWIS